MCKNHEAEKHAGFAELRMWSWENNDPTMTKKNGKKRLKNPK